MRIWIIAAMAGLAAACSPAQPPVETEDVAATISDAACDAGYSAPWRPLSGVELTARADIEDAQSCSAATARFSITDAGGNALFTETYPVEHVMILAGLTTVEEMNAAFVEWVAPATAIETTGSLPDWPAGADYPIAGEFPFYAEEAVTREAYLALRSRNLPLFCFVQGMESTACLVLENGALTKIGVQTFPG